MLMVCIVLPIALVAGALIAAIIGAAFGIAIINESIKKLLEVSDAFIQRAKIKRMLTKVIKKNTIDI
jgi:hypothetical protein